ncbi:STAS domain-containing protein [Alteribacter natronophilus]|uniref:STAS domain-containing protein n=1 Tax=Alteribacter natronophilus TaxID=2583810 RepID=UPI00110F4990|nr:STAS domain-containing protein [Alteribacter natronophilus]TMW72758.1 STAS domain-containing protein [Alteribacter natronophilus]
MPQNEELYAFLNENVNRLTEEWYASLDKSDSSVVYGSTDPEVINNLKRQNTEFHKRFFEVFRQENGAFEKKLDEWIIEIAVDEQHHKTPLYAILKEFNRTQDQHLKLIEEFAEKYKDKYSIQEFFHWYSHIDRMFRKVTITFVEEHTKEAKNRLEKQQELIDDLSSPVIRLSTEVALLPLVGDIDIARSHVIKEKAMNQCAQHGVNYLLLDLSGVVKIDQIVASELMQMIHAMELIGVTTTLSGMRPEIAQSAVKLGLNFDNVTVKSSLAESIRSRESYL